MSQENQYRIALMFLTASTAILLFFGGQEARSNYIVAGYLALSAISVPCLAAFCVFASRLQSDSEKSSISHRNLGLLFAIGTGGAFASFAVFLGYLSIMVLLGGLLGLCVTLWLLVPVLKESSERSVHGEKSVKADSLLSIRSIATRIDAVLRFVLTNVVVTSAWSVLFFFAGVALAYLKGDLETLPQSGALMVVGGVLLTSRRTIRLSIRAALKEEIVSTYGLGKSVDEEVERHFEFFRDLRAARVGFWLLFFGTIIAAFGESLARTVSGA